MGSGLSGLAHYYGACRVCVSRLRGDASWREARVIGTYALHMVEKRRFERSTPAIRQPLRVVFANFTAALSGLW